MSPGLGRIRCERRASPRGTVRGRDVARGLAAVAALGVAALASATPAAGADPPAPVRVGLIVEGGGAEADRIAAGFRKAMERATPGGRTVALVEEGAPAEDAERIRGALRRLADADVEAVVAIGDEAAAAAPGAVRDRAVVLVGADVSAAEQGGRLRGVATQPDPARIGDVVRDLTPGVQTVGVLGVPGGRMDALATALGRRGTRKVTVRKIVRDPRRDGPAAPADFADCEVLVAIPETPDSLVTEAARSCAGSGVALFGMRESHMDAGAAVVLRAEPADVGGLAAAACVDLLLAREKGPAVRRPARLLREVHLANARRLGFEVPLPLLASSDRTVVPPPERR